MHRTLQRALLIAACCLGLATAVGQAAEETVEVWFAGNSQGMIDAVEQQLKPRFEKETGIKLTVSFVPWSDLSTKLATSFAGGVAPDVFMHGSAATAGFAASGRLEPLDKYIGGMKDASDFGKTLDSGKYLGKRYMIPLFGAGRLLMYRADVFSKVGLDPNKAPSTWEEFLQAAQKLTVKRGSRFVREGIDLPTQGIDATQVWSSFLWQNGGDFFNDDLTAPIFQKAEGTEALSFLVDMVRKHEVANTEIDMGHGNIPPISEDRIGMLYAVPGDLENIRKYTPDVYEHIRIGQPTHRKEQATLFSYSGLFMSQSAKNKANAWKAISFFTSPEALYAINKAQSGLPPRQSMADADFVAKDSRVKAYVQAMRYGNGNPNIPAWVQARDILARNIEQAYFGQSTAEEALRRAAADVAALLKK